MNARIPVFVVAGLLSAVPAAAAPIRTLANLVDVTFYEATFGVTAHAFAPNSSALLNRLANPLSDGNNDFFNFPTEDYDVFYSRGDGTPDADGSFITIEAIWQGGAATGSMNITGVLLNFSAGPPVLFNFVHSFVMGSSCPTGCIAGSELLAVDGDLSFGTIPRFGGTNPGDPNERMRLTIGIRGISQDDPPAVPEPATLLLIGAGLSGAAVRLRRR